MPTIDKTPAPPKVAPNELLMPTLFGEGYGIYQARPANFILSFVLHTLMAAALLLSTKFLVQHHEEIKQQVVGLVMSDYVPLPPSKKESGGGGGGGDRDKLQASKGVLPKFSMDQKTPPTAVIRNDNPKLAVEQTVMIPPQIKLPQPNGPIGDLKGIIGPASNGVGFGGGIGNGSGGGIGSGTGRGVGPGEGAGIGGGPFRVGGGVSAPRVTYQPDPEYSEEARKAKYQGTVVLWVVVGPDGRVHDMRVSRNLGLGLDEKALEAVKQWRFEPATKDGKPVAVQVNIEVNFRLY